MFKWAMLFLALGVAAGCLGAMGVGAMALAELLLALGLMTGAALLIAWPFLKSARSATDENAVEKNSQAFGHSPPVHPPQ